MTTLQTSCTLIPSLRFLIISLLLFLLQITCSSSLLRLNLTRNSHKNSFDQLELLITLDSSESDPTIIQKEIANFFNIQYSTTLYFGETQEVYKLLIDTGSSWLWIPSFSYHGSRFVHRYSCKSTSKCSVLNNSPKSLRYGKGEINGIIAQAKVCLMESQYCAVNQPFYLITGQANLNGMEADGILGLGFRNAIDGYTTFLNNLKTQGVIKERIFSLFLQGKKHSKQKGELVIGGIDTEYIKGREFVYEDVTDEGIWRVHLQQVRLSSNSEPSATWHENNFKAMIDSGTSCIHVPYPIFEEFLDSLVEMSGLVWKNPSSTLRYYDCNRFAVKDLPTLELVFGGTAFKIEPDDYVSDRNNLCFVMFQPSPLVETWILGDVFMHTVYTLFDMDKKRVGFLKDDSTNENSLIEMAQGDLPILKIIPFILGIFICTCICYFSTRKIIQKTAIKIQLKETGNNIIELKDEIVRQHSNLRYAKDVI